MLKDIYGLITDKSTEDWESSKSKNCKEYPTKCSSAD